MNGHDDDELDIYGPQADDEALADYYETVYWFLAGTR